MWQLQHGSSPRIEQNSVETCLIVFMVSGGAAPRIESNTVTCAALSLGLVMDQSAGNIYNNSIRFPLLRSLTFLSISPIVRLSPISN